MKIMETHPLEEGVLEHETLVEALGKGGASPLRKYQDMYVGGRGLLALVRYELLTALLGPLPGALGFALRQIFYKGLFASLGKGAMIGPNVTLRCPGRITLGKNVAIDAGAVLDAKGRESSIGIGGAVLVGKDTVISCASAEISLGHDISIGPGCYLRASSGPVRLGSYVTIGAHTVLISGNPDYRRLDIPMMKQQGPAEGILVGDDVWMGVGVRVIDGVKVGSGSVIGAGAVVIEDVPAYAIVAGVPARVIGSRH